MVKVCLWFKFRLLQHLSEVVKNCIIFAPIPGASLVLVTCQIFDTWFIFCVHDPVSHEKLSGAHRHGTLGKPISA